MFRIIDDSLKMGGSLVGPMQSMYDLRSHIMHGPRMPARIDGGFLKLPRIATRNPAIGEWDDQSVWEDFGRAEFVYFADFCRSLWEDYFGIVGELHPKVFPAADTRFEGRRIAEPAARHTFDAFIFSGLNSFPAISAFQPPSGVR